MSYLPTHEIPDFCEVDRHVKSVDFDVFDLQSEFSEREIGLRGSPDPTAKLDRIKAVYETFRPILNVVTTLNILPPSWRMVAAGAMRAMDGLLGIDA